MICMFKRLESCKVICGDMLILVFLLIACSSPTNNPEVLYTHLIKFPECSQPCWLGIEIDKTSFAEAQEILAENYASDQIETQGKNSVEWKANGIHGVKAGYLSFHDGLVSEIWLTFDTDSDFTVEKLITVLGEPSWLFINDQPNSQCRGFIAEYPSGGVHAYLDIPEGQKNILPTTRVFALRFLPTKLSENLRVYDGYLAKWDGYKTYC